MRLTGSPPDIDDAVAAIEKTKSVAGIARSLVFRGPMSTDGRRDRQSARVLARLRNAGLDAIAELPLDDIDDSDAAVRPP